MAIIDLDTILLVRTVSGSWHSFIKLGERLGKPIVAPFEMGNINITIDESRKLSINFGIPEGK